MGTAYTKIFGLNDEPYFFKGWFAANLIFEDAHLFGAKNLLGIYLGDTLEEAKENLTAMRKRFKLYDIQEGSEVLITFDDSGNIYQISTMISAVFTEDYISQKK